MPTKLRRVSTPMSLIHELFIAELARRWECRSEADVVRRAVEECAASEGIAFRKNENGDYEPAHPNT